MSGDIPVISTSTANMLMYSGDGLVYGGGTGDAVPPWMRKKTPPGWVMPVDTRTQTELEHFAKKAIDKEKAKVAEVKAQPSMRVVSVFIADTDENLPVGKRMLFTDLERITDLTDQELFFEVPIAGLLETHNALRATTVNKKASEKFGRDVMLEPIRIRDLRMVVTEIATF